uniref:Uncharacterized protein n=1 Tax=Neobodo designis TaxID=312471 RepID=A0A7S1KZB6_NEODS
MFARSCPRMGVRFASGNVFYMNKTFSARHLQSVASPLSTGFITPARFASTNAIARIGGGACVALPTDAAVDVALVEDVMTLATAVSEVPAALDLVMRLPSTVVPVVCEHVVWCSSGAHTKRNMA